MSKRPAVDLMALTADLAAPMQEAAQRAPMAAKSEPPSARLVSLSFKVPPEFYRRWRKCAVDADLKLNELLFEALNAWEGRR